MYSLFDQAIELPNAPAELADEFDRGLYLKTQSYSRDKWCVKLFAAITGQVAVF